MFGARVARPADEEGERGRVAATTVPRYRAGKAPEWLQQDADEEALVPRGVAAASRSAPAHGAGGPPSAAAVAAAEPLRDAPSSEAAGVSVPVVLRRVEDPRLARLARLQAGGEDARPRRRRGDSVGGVEAGVDDGAPSSSEPAATNHRSRGRRHDVDQGGVGASNGNSARDDLSEAAVAAPVVLRRGGGACGDRRRDASGDGTGLGEDEPVPVKAVEGDEADAGGRARRPASVDEEEGGSGTSEPSSSESDSSAGEGASSSSDEESDGPALPQASRALRPIFVPKSQRIAASAGGVPGASAGPSSSSSASAAAPGPAAAFSNAAQAPLTAAADEAWEARARARAAAEEEAATRRRAETAAQARRAEAAEMAEELERTGAGQPQGLSDVDTDDDAADAVEELRLWRERELARLERDELARGARAAAAAIGRAARDGLPLLLTGGGEDRPSGPSGRATETSEVVSGGARGSDGAGAFSHPDREPSAGSRMHPDRAAAVRGRGRSSSPPVSPSAARGKLGQKYYHRGAFFQEEEDDASVRGRGAGVREAVSSRDADAPTGADRFDRSLLPEVMRVRNFGRRGQAKYKSLKDEDTTFEGRDRTTGWGSRDGRGPGHAGTSSWGNERRRDDARDWDREPRGDRRGEWDREQREDRRGGWDGERDRKSVV